MVKYTFKNLLQDFNARDDVLEPFRVYEALPPGELGFQPGRTVPASYYGPVKKKHKKNDDIPVVSEEEVVPVLRETESTAETSSESKSKFGDQTLPYKKRMLSRTPF